MLLFELQVVSLRSILFSPSTCLWLQESWWSLQAVTSLEKEMNHQSRLKKLRYKYLIVQELYNNGELQVFKLQRETTDVAPNTTIQWTRMS
jgi:hypothetical protein